MGVKPLEGAGPGLDPHREEGCMCVPLWSPHRASGPVTLPGLAQPSSGPSAQR